ncbi:hypothetical protein ACIOWG_12530 [Streptomyces sp. NPDC087658]|uniref:hypothetical protein n=1 Tax=Streptomyces sp. NPDC087658 TaxID=3365800 RepID=UPI00382EF962
MARTGAAGRADDIERVQLDMAVDLLGHAPAILDARRATTDELRFLARRLTEALTDALRVAESRGDRLPLPGSAEDAEKTGSERPSLPFSSLEP